MHISVEWNIKGTSFSVRVHKKDGEPYFLSLGGCKIAVGKDGEFVSTYASKIDDKWYRPFFMGKDFAAHVLNLAKEATPKAEPVKAIDEQDCPF